MYDKCWFCNKRDADDDSEYMQDVNALISDAVNTYYQVNQNGKSTPLHSTSSTLKIPRCKKCKDSHETLARHQKLHVLSMIKKYEWIILFLLTLGSVLMWLFFINFNKNNHLEVKHIIIMGLASLLYLGFIFSKSIVNYFKIENEILTKTSTKHILEVKNHPDYKWAKLNAESEANYIRGTAKYRP